MKTGDSFIDAQGRSWTAERLLGQGTWGRSWIVSTSTGRELVLKVALGAEDFPTDIRASKDLLKACADATTEQGALLASGDLDFTPQLESCLVVEGRPALLIQRYGSTLQRRMDAGMPLADALKTVARVTAQLHKSRGMHGNLRPSNILFDERGEPVLCDIATPATHGVISRLEAMATERVRYRPPEAVTEPRPGWDTWALCQVLYASAMSKGPIDDASPQQQRIRVPDEGLSKLDVATLKDRAIARLSAESANGRFRSRLTEKLGAVLNRGLSPASDPSPPYRFKNAAALHPRIEEITALLMPTVTNVGRILLGGAINQGHFQGGDAVTFSTSVACSAGITEHEDIVCGLQLTDVDAEDGGRVPVSDASFKVGKHASGRLRFQFSIPNLPPGRYRLKTAFSVRDSEQEPQVAQGAFEVRPQPGYIPPALDANPAPSPIGEIRPSADTRPETPSRLDEIWSSDPGSDADAHSDPGAEVIEGFFPKPIAPPEEQEEQVLPAIAEIVNETSLVQAEQAQTAEPLLMPIPAAMQAQSHFAPAGPAPSTPSMNAPSPPPRIIPKISIGLPNAVHPPPPPTSEDPGLSWSALSATLGGSEDHFAIEPDRLLPGAQSEGSDLPFWDESGFGARARSIPGFDQILAMVRRDSYSAFVAAAALSFVLLLVMMALLKAF